MLYGENHPGENRLNFRNKNSNKRHLTIPAKVERKIIMDTGIRAVVMEEIRELARRHGLEQVILFGSRARGIMDGPAI